MKVPRTPVQQGKKSFKRAVIGYMSDTQDQIDSIKKEMNEEIERKIEEKYGRDINTIKTIRDFAVIAIKMMKEKKLLKRKEIDEILAMIEEKNIGNLLL